MNKEKLKYFENILSLNNQDVDLSVIYNLINSHEEKNFLSFATIIAENFSNIDDLKEILIPSIKGLKNNNEIEFYENIFNLFENKFDIELLNKIIHTIKDKKDREQDILDSFSSNQLKAKSNLINALENFNVLNKNSNVVIWGSWYGSVLVPLLADRINQLLCLDMDKNVTQIGKKRFFVNYENVDYQNTNVFEKYLNFYKKTDLIINTSCEHMLPMNEWKWFGSGAIEGDSDTTDFRTPKLKNNCWFAFQSNNMFGIEGHINCVNSLEEFKSQLPKRAEVRYADEIEDTRGTRYMLIGKLKTL